MHQCLNFTMYQTINRCIVIHKRKYIDTSMHRIVACMQCLTFFHLFTIQIPYGRKLWRIWQINGNSPKFFFCWLLIVPFCESWSAMMKASVCGISFGKHFKCVAECRLFWRGNCTSWCATPPYQLHSRGAFISEIVVCSRFALGFTLVSTCIARACHASISLIADACWY